MAYEALFEDEDDIFGGSPRSKFMDVVFNANNDVVRYELEQLVEKTAIMELLLEKYIDEDIGQAILNYKFSNSMEAETKIKSLFVELMGDILSKSE